MPSNPDTGILALSDTGYSDTLLTVTLFDNSTFPKSVTVSTYLLTVTLCPGPNGVTVSKHLCMLSTRVTSLFCLKSAKNEKLPSYANAEQ